MVCLPRTPEMEAIARRVIWFEEPEQALADPVRFLAYAMTRSTPEDMARLRAHLSDDDLREVLDNAPPGIIGRHSWVYWNNALGRDPAPPQPRRFKDCALPDFPS